MRDSYRKRDVAGRWWMGPRSRRVGDCSWNACCSNARLRLEALEELGELANLTVMGSFAPSGIKPFSFCIAASASAFWSKRMKPTPLEIPAEEVRREMKITRMRDFKR